MDAIIKAIELAEKAQKLLASRDKKIVVSVSNIVNASWYEAVATLIEDDGLRNDIANLAVGLQEKKVAERVIRQSLLEARGKSLIEDFSLDRLGDLIKEMAALRKDAGL